MGTIKELNHDSDSDVAYFSDKEIDFNNRDEFDSEEEKELIFNPFYRGSSSVNTKGVGLGLSLSLQIVKLHKGFITFESTISSGTIFTITLPTETMG